VVFARDRATGEDVTPQFRENYGPEKFDANMANALLEPERSPLRGPEDVAAGAVLLRRGRPGQGHRRTSTVRSVRLPEVLWTEMERTARSKGLNLHQAMRAALLGWTRRAG
jgi:hypothetical protein